MKTDHVSITPRILKVGVVVALINSVVSRVSGMGSTNAFEYTDMDSKKGYNEKIELCLP